MLYLYLLLLFLSLFPLHRCISSASLFESKSTYHCERNNKDVVNANAFCISFCISFIRSYQYGSSADRAQTPAEKVFACGSHEPAGLGRRAGFDRACDGKPLPTRHALQLGSGRASQPQLVSRRWHAIRTQTKNASLGGGACKNASRSPESA